MNDIIQQRADRLAKYQQMVLLHSSVLQDISNALANGEYTRATTLCDLADKIYVLIKELFQITIKEKYNGA